MAGKTGTAAGRVVVAGLLCALMAGCGSTTPGEAAGPAPVPSLSPTADCGLDTTTDEPSGGYAGPPTDEETGGYAGPPTDQETGGHAGPPTDQEAAVGGAGPPTDGETGNGGGPCGPADWFDMTRDFQAYLGQHLTKADDGTVSQQSVRETRVRKVSAAGEASITFSSYFTDDALSRDAALRLARLFADWRREVYGDTGKVSVRTTVGTVLVTLTW
ncbi:hypothetical protein OG321_36400 [Streptomyces sp. NBC_00424]|uniref:hypothetical protein n=1 Tax=Streptomyces sp. NBC_00424 TaxID=2903648 RepID=UPI0022539DE6|nr:hypothetical protein [Streptomyces sp. NBC_00424]MCX5077936.1 hypothetical protein [Streptomyces sp. NBC_00424]